MSFEKKKNLKLIIDGGFHLKKKVSKLIIVCVWYRMISIMYSVKTMVKMEAFKT